MPDANPDDPEIAALLKSAKTIVVVGLSGNPEKDSHRVASYLQGKGYRIVPVNPMEARILGETSYPDLLAIPFSVDIVDVFRKVEAIPEVVEQSIAIKARAVWMQRGLAHHESAEKARNSGMIVVQSKCLKVEHQRLAASGTLD